MTEIRLDRARVMAIIGEFVAAGMAEHVRMVLKAQLGLAASPLDHAGQPIGAKGCRALRGEHQERFWFLLALHWGILHNLLNTRLVDRLAPVLDLEARVAPDGC
jgi:hypothetical protein